MSTTSQKWTLRHESRSYGTQQARNLYNSLTRDKGTRSALALQELLPSENGKANKGWVRRVPAAAVIPAAQVMATVIGSKAFVAGLASSW
jgi:predicted phage tail protein